MKDKMMEIYELLKENPVISAKCEDRIKFYTYPETAVTNKPFMIITPLDVSRPYLYASNDNLSVEFIYQIDFQSHKRMDVKELQKAARDELKKIGFYQLSNGLDEYFEETKRYVDARRYTGISNVYDTDY